MPQDPLLELSLQQAFRFIFITSAQEYQPVHLPELLCKTVHACVCFCLGEKDQVRDSIFGNPNLFQAPRGEGKVHCGQCYDLQCFCFSHSFGLDKNAFYI